MSSVITFDVTLFRQQFPAFANSTTYPDAMLQMYWDMATCYIDDSTITPSQLNGTCRQNAINMMTAHLAQISVIIKNNGQYNGTPKIINESTIDKISVSLTPPPFGNSQWRWWLETTPYGQMLLSLLEGSSIGGFYFGGLPETAAFRRVGGIFI
jgi:hypothetical protein